MDFESLKLILHGIARLDAFRTAGGAAAAGIGFHLSILNIEFEQIMFHFMVVFCLAFTGLVALFHQYGLYSLPNAVLKSLLVATAFHSSLLASIGVYRLLFHRCRSFPGPVGARLSRLYTAYLSSKSVQYNKELQKMHSKYGDFVRTGPREITIHRQSAVNIIYGPNSECRKSTWYGQTGNDRKKCSTHMTRDFNDHRIRRRAWDRGFSIKALSIYEPRIKAKVDLLVNQLSQRRGQPINITDWSMFFGFDLIGEVGFGKEFGQLTTGIEHTAIRPIHEHIKMLGIMSSVPWLLYLISCIPGATGSYKEIFDFCANEIRAKQKVWDNEKFPNDIVSWLLKAVHEKDPSAAPSVEALDDDSRIILLAGSDTMATTLSHSLFHLVKYPETQRKMQKLLDEVMPGGSDDWTHDKMKSLTYLDDFIAETLRLKPALELGGPRETPAGGIQVDEVFIPGKTNVLVPIGDIQRDPRYWQRAHEFIPERWGEKYKEMGTDKSPYFPFTLGAYSCPGKNLARLSVKIALSLLVREFEVSFAPGETGEAFDHEALDTFTVTLPPLQLLFSPRRS